METFDQTFCEKVSRVSISKFNSLGKTGKPVNNEWIIGACILKAELKATGYDIEVVSLGTGSKCLGGTQLPLNGDRLHDSHAEVIARRGFKLYLMEQLKLCLTSENSIFDLIKGEFSLKKNITFHFYCSNVPCGDASIFPKTHLLRDESLAKKTKVDSETAICTDDDDLPGDKPAKKIKLNHEITTNDNLLGDEILAKKKIEDSAIICSDDIYRTGAKCILNEPCDPKEDGSSYHVTGSLRTKPGRGDATFSHCCSDKMFKWTVLGLQGSLLSLFLNTPIYLETVTIGTSPFNKEAIYRALYSRFEKQLKYTSFVSPFGIKTPLFMQASESFPYTKSSENCSKDSSTNHLATKPATKSSPTNLLLADLSLTTSSAKSLAKPSTTEISVTTKPSPTSIIWSNTSTHKTKSEVSVEGKKLGTSKKSENTFKSRISVCRIELMRKCIELVSILKERASNGEVLSDRLKEVGSITVTYTYGNLKDQAIDYQKMWCMLRECVLTNYTKKPESLKNFSVDYVHN